MDDQVIIQIAISTAWIMAWLCFSWFTGEAVLALLGRKDGRAALLIPNAELRLFVSCCAGIAVQIAVLIMLALVWALKPVFVGAAVVAIFLGAVLLRNGLGAYWPETAVRETSKAGFWLELSPLIFLITAWVIRPLGPPTGHDDISYHLPVARFYLEQGGLVVNEYLRYPLHTHSYNLLYAVALMRDGTTMAQWVHGASGFLVMLGTWGLARHWFGWLSAVIATALLLLLKMFTESMGYAYADLGLTLFFTASVVVLVLWTQYRRDAWLWLSAGMAGTMLGTKYSSLVFGGLLGLVVIKLTRNFKRVLIYAGIAAFFGCFWYIRSLIISGNPVHPFASEIFGNYIWSADDIAGQWRDLGRHGIEKTPLNFLLLPWHLVTNPKAFHEVPGLMGWLVGAFYVSLLMFKLWSPVLRALSLLALAYVVFWFSTSHIMRYLIPVTPLLALCVASLPKLLLDALRGKFVSLGTTMATPARAALVRLGQLLVIIPVAAFWWSNLSYDLKRLPVAESEQDLFLVSRRNGYELLRAARAHPAIGKGPLLGFQFAADRFYYDGEMYGDWFGHYPFRKFFARKENGQVGPESPQFFWELLKADGIRGLAFSKMGGEIFYPEDLSEYEPWFEIVFSNQFGDVLVPRTDPPVQAQ